MGTMGGSVATPVDGSPAIYGCQHFSGGVGSFLNDYSLWEVGSTAFGSLEFTISIWKCFLSGYYYLYTVRSEFKKGDEAFVYYKLEKMSGMVFA